MEAHLLLPVLSSLDHGTHMIDILNSILPEAMAIDDREFAHGEDELIMRISEAGFPIISSNIKDKLTGKNLQGIKEHRIYKTGNYKIGVFSVLSPDTEETYLAERIRINSNPSLVKKEAQILKDKGADIIVLLSGYTPSNIEQLLDNGIIDIFIQSKTAKDRIIPTDTGFSAVHGSSDGNCLLIDIKINDKNSLKNKVITGTFLPLSNYQPDPDVQEKISYYIDKLDLIMGTVLGTSAVPIDTTREKVRTEENAFGNFIADALREYYGTDIAVFNGGSIRGNRMYSPGTEFTRKIIQRELPYYNKVVPVYVSGRQILQMREQGLSRIEDAKGGFLHVSGMKVKYSAENKAGSRVKSVIIGNSKLDVKRGYTLSVIDYLLKGGDGFTMLKNAEVVKHNKKHLFAWEVLRLYIEKNR